MHVIGVWHEPLKRQKCDIELDDGGTEGRFDVHFHGVHKGSQSAKAVSVLDTNFSGAATNLLGDRLHERMRGIECI